MSELSILELERETVELLPQREALRVPRKNRGKKYLSSYSSQNAEVDVHQEVSQKATATAITFGDNSPATAVAVNTNETVSFVELNQKN